MVSAIGADAASASAYAQSKALGEQAVLETVKDAVIVRPSIVFGPEDEFFNRFATMARYSPALPLIGGGKTRFQPVFVGDVAEAIARSVDGQAKAGQIYELGGPERHDVPRTAWSRCSRSSTASACSSRFPGGRRRSRVRSSGCCPSRC